MNKPKIYGLLCTLSTAEWGRFRKFVASPYFNSNEVLLELLDALEVAVHDAADAPLDKKQLFRSLYPDQEYSDKQLTYALSDLNLLGEQFLAQIHCEARGTADRELALLTELSERGLRKHFNATHRKLEKLLSGETFPGVEYHLLRSRLFDLLDQDHIRRRQRKEDSNITRAAEELDRFYLLLRLNYTCSMLDRAHVVGGEVHTGLTADWWKHFTPLTAVPGSLEALYFNAYHALRDDDEEAYFYQLKEILLRVPAGINSEDLTDIYLLALNYATRKLRAGEDTFELEALDLYQRGIGSGVLLREGELSHWTFTNVVKLSLRLGRYDVTEQFIATYRDQLPEAFRENAVNYSLAELHYATGDMEEAQRRLAEVAYSDPSYYLGGRVLLAKIYYETGAFDALSNHLAAFTVFLQRNNKIGKELRMSCRNFCSVLSAVLRATPDDRDRLRERIMTTHPLTERNWLLTTAS